MTYDFIIVGGGIVGLATAMAILRRRPGVSLLLLEKEAGLGRHQTGHNSGVIHAGIYYKPGSLKADLCRRGAQATRDFCAEQGIAFETPGKLVVATDAAELARLGALEANAEANGIAVRRLDRAGLKEMEPAIEGVGALFVPSSGIVDYGEVTAAMGRVLLQAGAQVRCAAAVDFLHEDAEGVEVRAQGESWRARRLVACAGLQSDRLARAAGIAISHRIVPFRGEYYLVGPAKAGIVRRMIYPVPDPGLPFLGVHLTPMMGGRLTVGPSAVLGFAREGYPRFSVAAADVADYLRFPGFWRLMRRHWRSGIGEMRGALSKAAYLERARKYCPSLRLEDLLPYEAGIRAQAVREDGGMVDDFLFLQTPRMLHVANAPSPAATSGIPIGETIADRVLAA